MSPTGGVGTAARPQARRTLSGPPPEAVAEVREAARAAERLHELGQELRFERDPESGRMRAELRDLDGTVLRGIPLGEVLEMARGEGVG
jgi:hypothetical protein